MLMAPSKQSSSWLMVLALACVLIAGYLPQTQGRIVRDASLLAPGADDDVEEAQTDSLAPEAGPRPTHQDTTGQGTSREDPPEAQTMSYDDAKPPASTREDEVTMAEERIQRILAASNFGPVILPITDSDGDGLETQQSEGEQSTESYWSGDGPYGDDVYKIYYPPERPVDTGSHAGRAAGATAGPTTGIAPVDDSYPTTVPHSPQRGPPRGQGRGRFRGHRPEGGPVLPRSEGDEDRPMEGEDDGRANGTDCLTLDECEEEIIDEFIQTWLTYEGIPGMVFLIGNSVSLVGLFATFFTFALFRQLRSTPRGAATMNFLVALFCAKLAFQVNPHFAGYDPTCSALAMFQHYFCLAAFLWMNVVAYDVMMEAFDARQAYTNGTMLSTSFSKRNYKRNLPCYAVFAWGIPLTVVVSCCMLELYLGGVFIYGNQEQCGVFGDEGLLYTLAFPLTIISILNMAFFVATVRWLPASVVLCRRKSQAPLPGNPPEEKSQAAKAKEAEALGQQPTASIEPAVEVSGLSLAFTNKLAEVKAEEIHVDLQVVGADSKPAPEVPVEGPVIKSGKGEEVEVVGTGQHISHRHVWAYVRMSVALSIAWLSGFLSVFTQTYWLWIMFVAVNSLQGVLVFVSLVITPPVLSLYMERFRLLPAAVCRNPKQATAKSNLNFGPYECNLPVVSDGYVLLEETTDIVFIQ